jgi:hypothetical protein
MVCISAGGFGGFSTVADVELLDVLVRFHDPQKIVELRRAIFSLVCQDYSPISIMLVTQRFSEEQVQHLADHLAPMLAINPQVGFKILNYSAASPWDARSALLNLGIRESTGRYLAFLDYDDSIFPKAYCDLIAELGETKCAVAFGSIAMKDADVFADAVLAERRRATFIGSNLIDLFDDNFCPLHSFVVDRTKADAKDLWFDESLCMLEDYDFLLRFCAKYPASFRLIGRFVGDYYIKNDGSNTLPGETRMDSAAVEEFRRFGVFIQGRKHQYLVSEAVQRQLGIFPPIAEMTIAMLLRHFA